MYYEHFGLSQAPFKITPNTEFFFRGGNRGPVLEALIYAITHGEGIVKVSGEVGSGKTMLCNMLQSRLPDTVESVYLANPSVGPEEVLHAIAFELQLGVDRGADRLEVMHALQDYLVRQHAEGGRVVVFIEESQSMPLATLEEIRLLSNLETRTDKLLQIVLFGQPELDDMLQRPDIRQLRDRIAHSFRLEPLTPEDVQQYLLFRLRAAGYRGPDIFGPKVVKQIAEASSGLTRRINLIADKAMLAAFSENTHGIEKRHVEAALRDTEFGRRQPTRTWRWWGRTAWIGLGALACTLLGATLQAQFYTSSPDSQTAVPEALSSAPTRLQGAADPPRSAKEASGTHSGHSLVPASFRAEPANVLSAPSERPNAAVSDVLEQRLRATTRWIEGRGDDSFSIQLFMAGDEEQLRSHLKTLPKFIDTNDVYMYRSVAQGRPKLNVLWGSYQDREAALEWLDELPASLRANRPYVRTIKAIRADMERNLASR